MESNFPPITTDILYEIIMNADISELNSLCKVNRFARELCQREDFFIQKYIHNRGNTPLFIDWKSIIEGHLISALNSVPPNVPLKTWREAERFIIVGLDEKINPEEVLIEAYNKQIEDDKREFMLSILESKIYLRRDYIGPLRQGEIYSQIYERYPILTKDNMPKLYYRKISIIVAPRRMLNWERHKISVIKIFRHYIGFAGYPFIAQLLTDIYNYRLSGYHPLIDHLYRMVILNLVLHILFPGYLLIHSELTGYRNILRRRIYNYYKGGRFDLMTLIEKIGNNRFIKLSNEEQSLYEYILSEVPKIIPKIDQEIVSYLIGGRKSEMIYLGKVPVNIL